MLRVWLALLVLLFDISFVIPSIVFNLSTTHVGFNHTMSRSVCHLFPFSKKIPQIHLV